jgi:hypothetical protein
VEIQVKRFNIRQLIPKHRLSSWAITLWLLAWMGRMLMSPDWLRDRTQ